MSKDEITEYPDPQRSHGLIRVGRRIYRGAKYTDPSYLGFKPILCLTASTPYDDLGPYVVKDENGVIIENRWQGSKVYGTVPKSTQRLSRWNPTVIWDHPTEQHVDVSGNLLPAWFAWNKKLFENEFPVRYPVGINARHTCLGVYDKKYCKTPNVEHLLGKVELRIKVYCENYCAAVRKCEKFAKLQSMLSKGQNLLIIEVDGPHQEDIDYYKQEYKVEDDFIERDTMLVNEKNIQIMLNDTKYSYGHGYCLAVALLDKEDWHTADPRK